MSLASATSGHGGGTALSPAALVASQRSNLQGPYDLPWLLERVADFGSEDPTWRLAGLTVAGKAESPPKPVQLLIPEMVLFDSAGHGVPSALFFTDRGGFLRAVRRPLRKEPPVMYDSMLQLMKQRQAMDASILKEHEAELAQAFSPTPTTSKDVQPRPMETFRPSSTPEVDLKVVEATSNPGSPRRREPKSPASPGKGWQVQQRKGAWKLTVSGPGGAEQQQQHRLTDAEVAKHFGATADGRAMRWPVGARLLQACFWLWPGSAPGGSHEGSERLCTYQYDALETEVPGAEHTGLQAIVTNHFERFSFLDAVRDRNRMSAVPNLLAQHLSYYCNLELVTGDFKFFKDRRAQLWLVEAKNLYFLPNFVRTVAGQAAATNEALPQKLFRYLSEEALQMLPVDDVTGTRCQDMLEQMLDHYQGIKAQHNVDALLRKEQEDMTTNIPVLEGTDMRALAQKFDGAGISCKYRDGKAGAPHKRSYRVMAPKQRLPPGRGRWFSAEAASDVVRAGRLAGEQHMSKPGVEEWKQARQQYKEEKRQREEKAKGENMSQLLEYQVSRTMSSRPMGTRQLNFQEAEPDGDPTSARSRPETAASNCTAPDSVSANSASASGTTSMTPSRTASQNRSSRRHGTRCRMLLKASDGNVAPQPKIEIVATPQAQSLLVNAGTGICPEGPTLDGLMHDGHLARTPGMGLVMCRRAAAPQARAVDVPPGAAGAAMTRVTARVREAEAEAEAAAGKAAAFARKAAEGGGSSTLKVSPRAGKSDTPGQSLLSITGGAAAAEPEGIDAADKNGGAVTARAVKRIVGPDGVNGHPSLAGFLAAPV